MPWILGVLVASLLGLYLVLQARWLGQLAEAQLELTPRFLDRAAGSLATECQSLLADVGDAVLHGDTDADPVAAALVTEVVPLGADEEPPPDLPAFVVQGDDGRRSLVVLDVERMRTEVFPALARAALGEDGLDTYRVAIVSAAGDAPALYRSHAPAPRDDDPPDATADLWLRGIRQVFRLGGPAAGGGEEWLGDGDARWTSLDEPVWIVDEDAGLRAFVSPATAPWRIEVRHRGGSLEVALERARARNLLLAGGLLTLVVAGVALLWIAEQRARRLAEKELAFVAGVSHELRTPLAVVRTAASNLRRGVVRDAAQVAEYGALIEQEAQRVSTLAERVLRFSSDPAPLVLEELDLEAALRAAVERCGPWRDRKRFEVVLDVAEEARSVRADAAALTSALHNLIENAVKYGDDGQTIRIRARRGADIVVEVTDEGPGIAAQDRARMFDPFYRGAAARAGDLPGSGLGLGVARDIALAHGGRLELVVGDDGARGATFALHLPIRDDGGAA